MVAKRFFYVCAGILCLALAYHFGARSATAQAGLVEAGNIESTNNGVGLTCAVGRTFYTDLGTPAPVPVPGSAPIVATSLVSDARGYYAMLENGDVYWWNYTEPTWHYFGNMLGSATPAMRETWGGVKARYRPGAAVAPSDK